MIKYRLLLLCSIYWHWYTPEIGILSTSPSNSRNQRDWPRSCDSGHLPKLDEHLQWQRVLFLLNINYWLWQSEILYLDFFLIGNLNPALFLIHCSPIKFKWCFLNKPMEKPSSFELPYICSKLSSNSFKKSYRKLGAVSWWSHPCNPYKHQSLPVVEVMQRAEKLPK